MSRVVPTTDGDHISERYPIKQRYHAESTQPADFGDSTLRMSMNIGFAALNRASQKLSRSALRMKHKYVPPATFSLNSIEPRLLQQLTQGGLREASFALPYKPYKKKKPRKVFGPLGWQLEAPAIYGLFQRRQPGMKELQRLLHIKTCTLCSIDLSGNKISNADCWTLGRLIRRNNLEKLILDRNHISNSGALILAWAARFAHVLEKLSLADNYIDDAGAWAISRCLLPRLSHNRYVTPHLKFLHLQNNPIRSSGKGNGMRSLARLVRENRQLIELQISSYTVLHLTALRGDIPTEPVISLAGCRLSDADAMIIGRLLNNNVSTTTLDLSNNRISNTGCTALAEGLRDNLRLQHLHLQDNLMGHVGAVELGKALHENARLETLHLARCPLTYEAGQSLASALHENKILRTLTLSRSLVLQVPDLRGLTGVRTIDLCKQGVTDGDTCVIGELLAKNSTLMSLDLSENHISHIGVKAVAMSLPTNTTLHVLNLSKTNPGEAGCKALSLGLQENSSLYRLDLSKCSISDKGGMFIGEGMKENSSIGSLDLRDNKIAEEGGREIFEAVQQNHVLTKLDLSYNKIPATASYELGLAIKSNTALTQLDLASNQLGCEGSNSLADGVTINVTLKHLAMQSNRIENTGAQFWAESFADNTSLRRLYISNNKFGLEQKRLVKRKFQGDTLDIALGFNRSGSSFGGKIPTVDSEILAKSTPWG